MPPVWARARVPRSQVLQPADGWSPFVFGLFTEGYRIVASTDGLSLAFPGMPGDTCFITNARLCCRPFPNKCVCFDLAIVLQLCVCACV